MDSQQDFVSVHEELLRAREFIKQNRFSEARSILVSIDHPTAEKWLQKMDEIDAARREQLQMAAALPVVDDPHDLDKPTRPLKKCPYCAEYILAEAVVCRYCGRDINARQAVIPRPDIEMERRQLNGELARLDQAIAQTEMALRQLDEQISGRQVNYLGLLVVLIILWFFLPSPEFFCLMLVIAFAGIMVQQTKQNNLRKEKEDVLSRLRHLHNQKGNMVQRLSQL